MDCTDVMELAVSGSCLPGSAFDDDVLPLLFALTLGRE